MVGYELIFISNYKYGLYTKNFKHYKIHVTDEAGGLKHVTSMETRSIKSALFGVFPTMDSLQLICLLTDMTKRFRNVGARTVIKVLLERILLNEKFSEW